jgi:hypothetical protein
VTILAGAASAAAAPLAPKQPPSSWSTLRKFSTFDYCCQQPAVQFKRLGHEESFIWGSTRMFPPAGNGCGLGPNAYGASSPIVRSLYVPMDVDWDGSRPPYLWRSISRATSPGIQGWTAPILMATASAICC